MIKTIDPISTKPRLLISETVYFKLNTERKAFGKNENESVSLYELLICTIPNLDEPNIYEVIDKEEKLFTLSQLNAIIGEIKQKDMFSSYDAIIVSIIEANPAKFWGLKANQLQICPNLF